MFNISVTPVFALRAPAGIGGINILEGNKQEIIEMLNSVREQASPDDLIYLDHALGVVGNPVNGDENFIQALVSILKQYKKGKDLLSKQLPPEELLSLLSGLLGGKWIPEDISQRLSSAGEDTLFSEIEVVVRKIFENKIAKLEKEISDDNMQKSEFEAWNDLERLKDKLFTNNLNGDDAEFTLIEKLSKITGVIDINSLEAAENNTEYQKIVTRLIIGSYISFFRRRDALFPQWIKFYQNRSEEILKDAKIEKYYESYYKYYLQTFLELLFNLGYWEDKNVGNLFSILDEMAEIGLYKSGNLLNQQIIEFIIKKGYKIGLVFPGKLEDMIKTQSKQEFFVNAIFWENFEKIHLSSKLSKNLIRIAHQNPDEFRKFTKYLKQYSMGLIYPEFKNFDSLIGVASFISRNKELFLEISRLNPAFLPSEFIEISINIDNLAKKGYQKELENFLVLLNPARIEGRNIRYMDFLWILMKEPYTKRYFLNLVKSISQVYLKNEYGLPLVFGYLNSMKSLLKRGVFPVPSLAEEFFHIKTGKGAFIQQYSDIQKKIEKEPPANKKEFYVYISEKIRKSKSRYFFNQIKNIDWEELDESLSIRYPGLFEKVNKDIYDLIFINELFWKDNVGLNQIFSNPKDMEKYIVSNRELKQYLITQVEKGNMNKIELYFILRNFEFFQKNKDMILALKKFSFSNLEQAISGLNEEQILLLLTEDIKDACITDPKNYARYKGLIDKIMSDHDKQLLKCFQIESYAFSTEEFRIEDWIPFSGGEPLDVQKEKIKNSQHHEIPIVYGELEKKPIYWHRKLYPKGEIVEIKSSYGPREIEIIVVDGENYYLEAIGTDFNKSKIFRTGSERYTKGKHFYQLLPSREIISLEIVSDDLIFRCGSEKEAYRYILRKYMEHQYGQKSGKKTYQLYCLPVPLQTSYSIFNSVFLDLRNTFFKNNFKLFESRHVIRKKIEEFSVKNIDPIIKSI